MRGFFYAVGRHSGRGSYFALGWLILPGFGIIDLSTTWDSEWPVMLEAGWGLFFSVLVGLPFLVIALRPTRAVPAIVELAAPAVVLSIAAAVSLQWQALLAAGQTALCAGLADRERLRPESWAVHRSLLASAFVGAPMWLTYAG